MFSAMYLMLLLVQKLDLTEDVRAALRESEDDGLQVNMGAPPGRGRLDDSIS